MKRNPRRLCVAAVALLALGAGLIAIAQDNPDPAGRELNDLWDDFVHYVIVARPELAKSFGQAILDSGASAEDVYKLYIDTEEVESVLSRAEHLNNNMKPMVDQLRLVIEAGYLELRADPVEIANAIEMLGEGARGFSLATDRLIRSGEYAMPQLVQKLIAPDTDPHLVERIIAVLPRIGLDAVRPLSVALQTDEEKLQKILGEVLADIQYPHAVPRLRELHDNPELLPRVKGVVARALRICGGAEAQSKPLAALYYEVALAYYDRHESVQSDPRYGKANVWFWEPTLGVVYKEVPREIFCDIYAMRMARLALQHDPEFYPAVSLWLSAAIRREIDLPAGQTDPLWPADQPPASFYVRAAGAGYAQEVLARALTDHNADVAIATIEALADTAGSGSLVESLPGGAQPLVQALTYGNRRVRYLAAYSLALALPDKPFAGSQLVLSVLNEALRQRGRKTALLVAADQAEHNVLQDAVRAAGFVVIDEPDANQAVVEGIRAGGVDLIVVGRDPRVVDVLTRFRRESVYTVTPVAVVAPMSDALRDIAETDGRMALIPHTMEATQMAAAMLDAASLTAGPALGEQEITDWAVKAAEGLQYLGLTGNETYDLTRSRQALINALASRASEVRIASAQALSVMEAPEAQKAIVTLATDPAAREPVRLAALNSLAASVRRFGNALDAAEARAILEIVISRESHALRGAAAQVLGALDLPSDQVEPLILETDASD